MTEHNPVSVDSTLSPPIHISLYYNNVRGMSGKKDDILLSTTACDYDVIALSETWLDSSKFSTEFFDPRFIVYRKDRSDSNIDAERGGGVLIAIDSKYDSNVIDIPELAELEAICATINLHSSNSRLFIYCLYIQPGATDVVYESHVKAILKAMSLLQHGDIIYLAGDFNMPSVKWLPNDDGFDFLPLTGDSTAIQSIIARTTTTSLIEGGLFQLNNSLNHSSNVLDLVYTNMPELAVLTTVTLPIIPDSSQDRAHVPIHCLIECEPLIFPPSSDPSDQIYCFKKASFNMIREALNEIDFNQMFSGKGIEEMVSSLYNICYEIFDQYVPKVTIRTTNHPVWYDNKLINLKNRRNRAYKKLLDRRFRNSVVPDENDFVNAKSEFEAYQTELFNKFLSSLAINYKKKPTQFWNYINSKYKKVSFPGKMVYLDEHATNDDEKANLFAKFFASVYKNHESDSDNERVFLSMIAGRNDHGFQNVSITPDIVSNVLCKMDLNKGVSPDKMAPLFLRACADLLAEPLSVIYSRSLSESYYPNLWKIGCISPIFKSGLKTDINNYRGVCVSPNFGKVFEIIVMNQIKYNVYPHISDAQHGFFPGRRIESNLMELSLLVHDSFSKGFQTDIFYADLRKAFDAISTSRMVLKLSTDQYKFSNRLLLWFRSFFQNRKQFVKINSSKSALIDVLSGVGQGSNMGPLLFDVYFNDSDHLSTNTKDLNFADDKKIIHNSIRSIDDTPILQMSIDKFVKWCIENDLELNVGKCYILSITRKLSPVIAEYFINGTAIQRVHNIKDLGVHYDSKFTFTGHQEFIVRKAQSMLSFIKRQCHGRFNVSIAKLLYSSIVRSHLEFASSIWSPYHNVHIQSMESVQKQFVLYANHNRYTSADSYNLRPYIDRCAELNLQSLVRRRINTAVFFIHDVLIGKINSQSLRDKIVLNTSTRYMRNPPLLRLTSCRNTYSNYSPFNFACRLFNLAVAHVDPTVPSLQFRHNVIQLDNLIFGSFGRC